MSDITIDSNGLKSTVIEIPGLGATTVGAYTNAFRLTWTRKAPAVINGVEYHGDVMVTVANADITVALSRAYGGFRIVHPTDAARKRVTEAVSDWFPTFVGTDLADEILASTVSRYNALNRERVAGEIAKAEQLLRELRELSARLDAAGPTDHVAWSDITYELRKR